MPVIRMAKPMKISPIFFFFSSFEIILKRIPINASRGAKVMGLSSVRKKLSPPMPARLKSHAVRVVPTFEPITTPKVSQKSTMPEFTRPTSITVIAEDDCMAMVIPAPRKKLKNGFRVTFFKVCSKVPPVRFSSPPDSIDIP